MEQNDEEFENDSSLIEEDDALTLDDLATSFIKNPPVGEEVTFTVSKVVKLEGKDLIVKKKDGSTFSKNLSSVDYGYEVVTEGGARYTLSSWEVFGKMKSIFKKLGKIAGVTITVFHIKDGMKERDGDTYKVTTPVDGVEKQLDRETQEWVD